MRFTKELDSYVRDSNGKLTEDRFVCMRGYGYDVHITFHKSGCIHVSIAPDRESENGEFFPNIFIRYADVTPDEAVADFNRPRELTAERLDEYIAELARTKEAVLAFNELLTKLDKI